MAPTQSSRADSDGRERTRQYSAEQIADHLARALDADDMATKDYHIRSVMQFRAAEDGEEVLII